jgi:hypothetical protein
MESQYIPFKKRIIEMNPHAININPMRMHGIQLYPMGWSGIPE